MIWAIGNCIQPRKYYMDRQSQGIKSESSKLQYHNHTSRSKNENFHYDEFELRSCFSKRSIFSKPF